MTRSSDEPKKTLQRWNEMLIEETLAASDDEIMEDAAVLHEDPRRRARDLRRQAAEVVAARKRKRLQEARAAVDAERAVPAPPTWAAVARLPLGRRRGLAQSIAERPGGQHITIAARLGEETTDADLDGFLRDALELGLISTDDIEE